MQALSDNPRRKLTKSVLTDSVVVSHEPIAREARAYWPIDFFSSCKTLLKTSFFSRNWFLLFLLVYSVVISVKNYRFLHTSHCVTVCPLIACFEFVSILVNVLGRNWEIRKRGRRIRIMKTYSVVLRVNVWCGTSNLLSFFPRFSYVRCRVSCRKRVFWKSFRNLRQGRVTHQRGPACEQQLNRETRSGPHCSPPCCFAEFQAWGRLYQVRIVAFENQPPRFIMNRLHCSSFLFFS